MSPDALAGPTLLLAARGAAAVLVLAVLVGGLPRLVQLGLALTAGLWSAALVTGGAAGGDAPGDLTGAMIDAAHLGGLGAGGGATWALVLARELAIGATLGVLAAVPLLAAAMAGRLVDVAEALGGAAPRRPYAGLFGLLAAAVFVGIDGHVAVIAAIVDSHRALPAVGALGPRALGALGALVPGAVALAIPWLVTAAVVQLALGAGRRVAARAGVHAPAEVATPAALAMITAALIASLAVAMAAVMRGAL